LFAKEATTTAVWRLHLNAETGSRLEPPEVMRCKQAADVNFEAPGKSVQRGLFKWGQLKVEG
jgi:hypothetical protein